MGKRPKVFHILNVERTISLCGKPTRSQHKLNGFSSPGHPTCISCLQVWEASWEIMDEFADFIPREDMWVINTRPKDLI